MAKRLAAAWLALAILTSGPVAASADLPRPRQLGVADGLPANVVNDLVEDAHGYLWVATSDGLARYDGSGFRVWRVEQGLPDGFLWSLDVDARGRIWLGTTTAGLARYDPATDGFTSFNHANTPGIENDQVWTVAVDREDAVWFGTAGAGLHRLDPDGRVVRFMPVDGDERSLPSASVTALEVAPDGSLWVGTRAGVARWSGRDFDRIRPQALPDGRINGLSFDGDGVMWVGTAGGAVARMPDGSIVPTPWEHDGDHRVLQVLLRDARGDYWLDIPAGLGYAGDDGRVHAVPLYSESSRGEVRPYWSQGRQDREGGVWLVSSSHALWYLPAGWDRFAIHARQVANPHSLGNANVRGMAPARGGGMWLVGTGGALDRFDPDSGRVERVREDVGEGVILDQVHEDSRGRLWVGYSAGLARLDRRSGEVRRWSVDQPVDALPARMAVSGFAESGDGRLWLLSGNSHVQARDLEGRVLQTFSPGADGLQAEENIKWLATGPDGRPWLATSRGVRRLDGRGSGWESAPGVDQGSVVAMAVEQDMLWVAGVGSLAGYRWDGARMHRVVALGAEDGLPVALFTGLVRDAYGVVWLTSTRGLVRVDTAQRAVRVFGVGDGLPSQDMRNPPVLHPGDGRLLIGTPDGLVVLDPAVDSGPGEPPNLVVEQVGVRGRPAFAPDRPFTLRHGDRDLRVVARLLSFRNPSAHSYRFRLAGYDDDWVETGALGERVFSQLPAGEYRLEVVARSADDLWSEVRTLAFRVAPPWWRTPLATALMALAASALLWWLAAAYRARLKRRHAWQLAEHKRELAEQASLAKTRFLATLGHEVRTPMTGVLGMSELLLGTSLDGRQRRYAESIRGAGEHLLRLVNDALDLARIEAGRLELDPQPFDPRELIGEVGALMAPLAEKRGLEYGSDVDRDVPAVLRGDVVRIRQILLNLLGNAIKFTERGHVRIRAQALSPSGLRLTVSDTGPGLNAEQKERLFRRFEQAEGARTASRYGGSGLGLAICQELAAEMGGRIEVVSKPGVGTRFVVKLPMPASDRAAAPAAAEEAVTGPGGGRILLVEDDPTVAEVVVGLLSDAGHAVHHVGHGLAALTELDRAVYDASLIDLDLPGIDGIALARQLRGRGHAGPLVAITARADPAAEAEALAAGFDAFLRKPLTGAVLAAAVADVRRRSQAAGHA